MVAMAKAAVMGGAAGIRAEGPDDVRAIVRTVPVPVIGLYKVEYPDSPVYITPTLAEVEDIIRAGADIVAIDATARPRPGQAEPLEQLVETVHRAGKLAMADIATLDEAAAAADLGFDLVGTTMSGYTGSGPVPEEPDIELVSAIAKQLPVPVVAEGRYWTPEQAVQALEAGAHCVVVGTAITNPWLITERFVRAMQNR